VQAAGGGAAGEGIIESTPTPPPFSEIPVKNLLAVAFLVALVSVAVAQTRKSWEPPPPDKTQRWQYEVISLEQPEKFIALLNHKAAEGYEIDRAIDKMVILKRPVFGNAKVVDPPVNR
jgi:hypothetical protein